jgi:hypothetical protein
MALATGAQVGFGVCSAHHCRRRFSFLAREEAAATSNAYTEKLELDAIGIVIPKLSGRQIQNYTEASQ